MSQSRDDAWNLVCEFTQSESLRRHMLAVEAAMVTYAGRFGEDKEKWSIVGLLHDFDYERWPKPPDHPLRGAEILGQLGYPEDVIYAIKSHADYLEDCPRVSQMDKTLYACDELAGFISACAIVRPCRHPWHETKECAQEDEAEDFCRRRQPRRHRDWSGRSGR